MNDPNIIYYNANLYNGNDSPIIAEYLETRTQPLLSNPTDYLLSIIRFKVPSISIPVFRFYDNTYAVTLSYDGNDSTVYLEYVPDAPSDYNYNDIFYFQQFIDSINTACNTAITTLVGAPTSEAIQFFYDRDADAIDFIFPKSYVNQNIYFYMNEDLYNKFKVINAYNDPSLGVKQYKIILQQTPNNNWDTNYYVNKDASAVAYLFDWDKIVITTNMPIYKESVSSANSDGTPFFLNVLSDFIISNTSTADVVTEIIYNPSANFRYIDINSNIDLRTIDYKVYYQKKDRTLVPLYLSKGESINIKFMFIKKALLNDNNNVSKFY